VKYLIQMNDDTVEIMQTVGTATVEQCIAKWHVSKQSRILSHASIDSSMIPTDRTFRNAWSWNGTEIVHNMPKCREIHRAKLRELRRPLFAENDLAIRDAQIDGDSVKLSAAVARRNALRDVTADPRIDAAQTPEELKTILPEVLK